ncbi:MAG: DUF1028 domain-containing protein [Candidatus Eisenbacteria bacterium]
MRIRFWLIVLLAFALVGFAAVGFASGSFDRGRPPLCATFSIVARDTTTGEIGVAVQSHWFSVGSMVPWAEAGVGAVATQSFVEPAYGPKILARIRSGERATDALVEETDADTLRDVRQVLVIDAKGNSDAYTGPGCMPYCGHHVARDHVCAGNLLAADKVWERMSEAFEKAPGTLGERLIAALEAGQAAGGDSRGMQSAALVVVKVVDAARPWKNRVVDLRVEDSPQPIAELKRLYVIRRAYDLADEGDNAFARKDYAAAMRLYDSAVRLVPDNDELIFWRGSMKMGMGDEAGAVADSRRAIEMNPRWKTLIARLPDAIYPGVERVCARLGIERK